MALKPPPGLKIPAAIDRIKDGLYFTGFTVSGSINSEDQMKTMEATEPEFDIKKNYDH